MRTLRHPPLHRGLALVLALGVLAACGSDAPATTSTVSLDRPRVAADAAAGAALAAALDRFGGALYDAVAHDADHAGRNVALSPYSVAAALLMVRAGTVGPTRDELEAALHLSGADADAGFATLDLALAAQAFSETGPDGRPRHVVLDTANAVWAQQGLPLEQPFLETLAGSYGAGVHLVDYEGSPEAARVLINRWVAERTHTKIPELIGRRVLDTDTRVVLTNALYLDATWAVPFERSATTTGPFTRRDGTTVQVPGMQDQRLLPFATGDGWRAIELPYAGNRLAMDVILPDAGRFDAVEQGFADGLAPFVAALAPAGVRLRLPKFTFRTTAALVDPLRRLGVTQLFDARADLSAMTRADDLYVSDVLHDTFLAVTEEGTVAAAATAVVAKATSGLASIEPFVVDRPFLFAIRDTATGAVLLAGRVLDPTAD